LSLRERDAAKRQGEGPNDDTCRRPPSPGLRPPSPRGRGPSLKRICQNSKKSPSPPHRVSGNPFLGRKQDHAVDDRLTNEDAVEGIFMKIGQSRYVKGRLFVQE